MFRNSYVRIKDKFGLRRIKIIYLIEIKNFYRINSFLVINIIFILIANYVVCPPPT